MVIDLDLADRFKRQDLLVDQLMLLVTQTMKNYVLQSSACLDWKDCLMTQEVQGGN